MSQLNHRTMLTTELSTQLFDQHILKIFKTKSHRIIINKAGFIFKKRRKSTLKADSASVNLASFLSCIRLRQKTTKFMSCRTARTISRRSALSALRQSSLLARRSWKTSARIQTKNTTSMVFNLAQDFFGKFLKLKKSKLTEYLADLAVKCYFILTNSVIQQRNIFTAVLLHLMAVVYHVCFICAITEILQEQDLD